MLETANELRNLIAAAMPLLLVISNSGASAPTAPEKWTRKEILGHLIDSASNNHQKFIRTMADTDVNFPGYDVDLWVGAQIYNKLNWTDLLVLWRSYNIHLAAIIERVDRDHLKNTIKIGDNEPVTLEFVMKDYVQHLNHHLLQILPGTDLN